MKNSHGSHSAQTNNQFEQISKRFTMDYYGMSSTPMSRSQYYQSRINDFTQSAFANTSYPYNKVFYQCNSYTAENFGSGAYGTSINYYNYSPSLSYSNGYHPNTVYQCPGVAGFYSHSTPRQVASNPSTTSPAETFTNTSTSPILPATKDLQWSTNTSPNQLCTTQSSSNSNWSVQSLTNDSGYFGSPYSGTVQQQQPAIAAVRSSVNAYSHPRPADSLLSKNATSIGSMSSTCCTPSSVSSSSFEDLLPLSPLMLDEEASGMPLSPTSMTSGDMATEPTDILAAAVLTLSDTSDPASSSDKSTDILAAAVATLNETADEVKPAISKTFTRSDIKQPASTRVYRKRNKLLNQTAINIMTEWFESHLNHPYPTQEEKELMAEKGGITLAQVVSWFNNKRNRSSNTAPKKQKRKLEQQLSTLCSDLMSGSRSGQGQASEIVNDINKLIEESLAPNPKKRRV